MSARWTRADWILTALLCLSSFLFAKWYLPVFRAGGGVPQFYQDQFGPAVMRACGRGFVNVDSGSVPAFDDFLKQRTATLRCEDLPGTMRPVELTGLQGSSRYLMTAAALTWRATGIRFSALDGLIAVLFAVSVGAAYAAVRCGCGRIIALIVVVLWASSYRHLENLPHLRDYSKAPFFILMLLAMGIVAAERRPGRLLAVGAAFGAIQGLGFGMRTDAALNFAPFLLVLFAAASGEGMRALRSRLACAVAALMVFTVVALPILHTYAEKSSLWHVVLLGFTSPYDENLNIGFPRTAYHFPYAYNDSYIEAVVRAFWARLHPADPLVTMLTPAYDRAGRVYFFRIASIFPGDVIARGVSSMAGITNLPFWLPDGDVPIGVASPVMRNIWHARGVAAQSMYGSGLLIIAAVLMIIGIQAPLYALVAFLLVWFWGAFPAIEFQGRHIFQFEFVMLAVIAWAGTLLWRVVATPAPDRFPRFVRSVVTLVVLIGAATATLTAARAYQIPKARAFLASYARAAATPLSLSSIALPHNTTRLGVDLFHEPTAREQVEETMLKAEFDFAQCGHPPAVGPVFRYTVSEPWFEAFSRETPLEDLGAPPTRVFLPVYSVVHNGIVVARFAGVEVPTAFARCVRLSRIDDTRDIPLLIPVTMATDWQRKLYERVRFGSGLGY